MLNPPEFELYDLQEDPYEWNNLSDKDEYSAIMQELKEELNRWQIETGDPFVDISLAKRFSDEIIATDLERVEIGYHGYMR